MSIMERVRVLVTGPVPVQRSVPDPEERLPNEEERAILAELRLERIHERRESGC